jgi:hypothetical protein
MNDEITQAQAQAEGRLIVEMRNASGEVISREFGLSEGELLRLHEDGKCHATCSHCHQRLANEVGEQAAVERMFLRVFGKRMPPNRGADE